MDRVDLCVSQIQLLVNVENEGAIPNLVSYLGLQ
jgi:hypothetical protein